ncbi:PucR family transcriptional regulator [Streptomyces jumonjinensis]|uniref:PucR family transcriptional regulator n=1 Tax=Streptomyces jumonjinensis TaxID=1945 RepID=UPI00379ED34B
MDAAPTRMSVPAGPVQRPGAARHAVPRLVAAILDRSDEREMLWTAMAAIAALGPFVPETAYTLDHGPPQRCPRPHPADPAASRSGGTSGRYGNAATAPGAAQPIAADRLDRLIGALDGHSRCLDDPDGPWIRAIALRHRDRCLGYLVVRILAAPSDQQTADADLIARETAAALAALARCRGEPAPPRAFSAVRDAGLGATVFRLAARSAFHEALARAAASGGGEQAILRTLYEHTGFAARTEDLCGHPRARVGPGGPRPEPAARDREELVRRVRSGPGAVRDRDRLTVPIAMAGELLGLLSLADPESRATDTDVSALEQTALVLAPELAHERRLAELEPRLRHDLVEKLISGTATDEVFVQAAGLGHELHRPHRVAVLRWPGTIARAAVGDAVERAAGRLGLDVLTGVRGETAVALLAGRDTGGEALYRAVSDELGTAAGAVGVGGPCEDCADLPHSYDEAVRALTVRRRSHEPHGGTGFEELGLCRMMGAGDGEREADRFVREWLGPLLDYDARHTTGLTATLSYYLESGGSYDATAEALRIHRSTVRYRLQRIREVTGHDLGDVDTRLNLHVASRIHHVLDRPR